MMFKNHLRMFSDPWVRLGVTLGPNGTVRLAKWAQIPYFRRFRALRLPLLGNVTEKSSKVVSSIARATTEIWGVDFT